MPTEDLEGFRFPVSTGRFCFFEVSSQSQPGLDGLWATDGTADGTSHLLSCSVRSAAVLGDGIVFWPSGCERDGEIWVSDGSPEGTRQVADVVGTVSHPVAILDRVVFRVVVRIDDNPILTWWSTDGSTEGTAPLRESLGQDASWRASFRGNALTAAAVNDRAVFLGYDPVHGW